MANLADAIRKSVPRVMRVGGSGEPQPTEQGALKDALRIREEIIGARMLDRTYEEIEHDSELKRARQQAELAEAKAKELEATVKLEEAKAKSSGNGSSGGQPSPLMVMLNSVIDNLQGNNQNLIQELKETREGALSQALAALKEEISSLKSQTLMQGATHTKSESVEGFVDRIEEVRKAIDMLKTFTPSPPETANLQGDFQTVMLLRKMNDDMILRMEELKDRRDQVQWDRAMERERLNLEERRSKRMSDTLGQYAPVISNLAYERLGITPPSQESQPQGPQCPSCQNPLILSNDGSVAFCPSCAQSYQVKSG